MASVEAQLSRHTKSLPITDLIMTYDDALVQHVFTPACQASKLIELERVYYDMAQVSEAKSPAPASQEAIGLVLPMRKPVTGSAVLQNAKTSQPVFRKAINASD